MIYSILYLTAITIAAVAVIVIAVASASAGNWTMALFVLLAFIVTIAILSQVFTETGEA